ncbi:hypothetical protein IGB42_03995 [Andreprevotia sp. IGB-42]|uniref:carbohydrate-binding protein n=1 Tax=Andreprevotia sp. IGB-42 TaxID=2497473 RepID=UPI0013571A24|nr:carbohydrate-binding protein [Andreprevotia sp. IGB-42]KAF0811538.1 hypothetical protein IGB42_03995 [Andreprevotia sp. IGB-42]
MKPLFTSARRNAALTLLATLLTAPAALAADASCPLWAESNTAAYQLGDVVSYNGSTYTALQSHTPFVGTNWNPALVASLWQAGGACSVAPTCDKPGSVALVVDSAFATPLAAELVRLAADIQAEQNVCVHQLAITPNSSAPLVKARLKALAPKLRGAILIGDIPAVQEGDASVDGASYPALLSDAYYEVLSDAFWNDPDGNGIFNRSADVDGNGQRGLRYDLSSLARTRDIWTGRLQPPAALGIAERISLLRSYLDRNHAYRTGSKHYGSGMVYFNSVGHNTLSSDYEIDQATNLADAQAFYADTGLFAAPASTGLNVIWNNDMAMQAANWFSAINQPKEYAYINIHGAANGQEFSPTVYMGSDAYRNNPANALLVDMASCNNGMFSAADYLAGYALFYGQALAVRANTDLVFQVGRPGAGLDHRLLAAGYTLGDARRITNPIDITTLFGDPTLRLRQPTTAATLLTLSSSEMQFPDLSTSSLPAAPSQTVTLTNTSSQVMRVYRAEGQYTAWNGQGTLNRSIMQDNGYSQGIDPFFLLDLRNADALYATLQPGQSVPIKVYFVANFANAKPGQYSWQQQFYTDSPAMPLITVKAVQRVL